VIVVFGSANVDLIFPVERLPTAGETVLTQGYRVLPGGKGANQAIAAARAGATVAMAGAVGDDGFGRVALAAFRENGVDVSCVAVAPMPTGCAAIAVDRSGENQIVVGRGANALAQADRVPDAMLGKGTTLMLQHEVPIEASIAMAVRAKRLGSRVIMNLAPAGAAPVELMANIDLLVVNEHEAATLLRSPASGEQMATTLARRHRMTVIVTLGRAGAVAVRPDDSGLRIAAPAIEPTDTTGAGDAFVGVLAASLDRGKSLDEALRRASVAGALACLKEGAQSALPTVEEIDAAVPMLDPAVPIGPRA
jgi:ribokinase